MYVYVIDIYMWKKSSKTEIVSVPPAKCNDPRPSHHTVAVRSSLPHTLFLFSYDWESCSNLRMIMGFTFAQGLDLFTPILGF